MHLHLCRTATKTNIYALIVVSEDYNLVFSQFVYSKIHFYNELCDSLTSSLQATTTTVEAKSLALHRHPEVFVHLRSKLDWYCTAEHTDKQTRNKKQLFAVLVRTLADPRAES